MSHGVPLRAAERKGMALRSQEEISLAAAFARTLRNVIALSSSAARRVWPGPAAVV